MTIELNLMTLPLIEGAKPYIRGVLREKVEKYVGKQLFEGVFPVCQLVLCHCGNLYARPGADALRLWQDPNRHL